MPNALGQAGATVEPSEYASLTMDEQFTGMWTQRNPLRDADVPYLYRKFYSASRFDSMIDGINREINAKLDDQRRPGSSVWNSQNFPRIYSFFSFKWVQNSQEVISPLADCSDGNIYDVTSNNKTMIWTKSVASARARFLSVGSTLYWGDGYETMKTFRSPVLWTAGAAIAPGTLLEATPYSMVMALGGITMNITAVEALSPSGYAIHVDPNTVPDNFADLIGVNVTFSGLTTATALNGTTVPVTNIISTTLGIFYITSLPHAASAPVADTGQCTTGNGITGSTRPTFSTTQYAVTADAGQQWKCYGNPTQTWGLPAPTIAPTVTPAAGTRFWTANTVLYLHYSVIDTNGNIQMVLNYLAGSGGVYKTGRSYPKWNSGAPAGQPNLTGDGSIVWTNLGQIGAWFPATKYYTWTGQGGTAVILDTNNNLQWCSSGSGGLSSGSPPTTWGSAIGATTTDGALTWTCLGPGLVAPIQNSTYAFSYHSIDGSVSTASPTLFIQGGVLGSQSTTGQTIPFFTIQAPITLTNEMQTDQIWIWRTAEGQATLILEDQLAVDSFTTQMTYGELGIPDTSLNAEIPAPVAHLNDPPPAGFTGPEWHGGCIWGFVGNILYRSGGAPTVTGNGNTAFDPLDYDQLPELIVRLKSISMQNGGLLIWTTSDLYVVLGEGTDTNPFLPPRLFMAHLGLLSYDALAASGSTLYGFSNHSKVFSLDPGNGDVEIGFPIGDQFLKVTTGGVYAALYDPASTYVTWHEASSADTGLYVSDGNVGWFRWSPISPPESGSLWNPRAAIVDGTSAVQSIETSPGVFDLLIAPQSALGPIRKRDATISGDWHASTGTYVGYPSWDVKGSIGLCETGEIAEIAHIALKSVAVGSRPTVSLLLDELQAGVTVEGRTTAWDVLSLDEGHHEDPPNLTPSITMYSDRYKASSTAITPKCENFQLKVDYGTQQVPDELLKFAVFGAVLKERRQQ